MIRPFQRLLQIAAAGTALMLPAAQSPAEDGARPPSQPMRQMACAARNEIVRTLREQFGEKPVAHGLADSGVLAEIFSGPQGTWTIVATTPNGVSCLIGSGQSFQTVALDDTI